MVRLPGAVFGARRFVMVRTLVGTSLVIGALALAPARAHAEGSNEDDDDRPRAVRAERKNEAVKVEDKSADAEAGERLQKKSKASGKRAVDESD
jgi:hypothetical protein